MAPVVAPADPENGGIDGFVSCAEEVAVQQTQTQTQTQHRRRDLYDGAGDDDEVTARDYDYHTADKENVNNGGDMASCFGDRDNKKRRRQKAKGEEQSSLLRREEDEIEGPDDEEEAELGSPNGSKRRRHGHSHKRPLEEEQQQPSKPRRKGKHAFGSSRSRRAVDSPERPSRFKEASMHDRASEKPPSMFTRFMHGNNGMANVDQLMEDYHAEHHRAESTKAQQPQSTGPTHQANRSISRAATAESTDTADTKDSGIFRFGRSLASTFGLTTVYQKIQQSYEAKKQELMAEDAAKWRRQCEEHARLENQRKLDEQKARAEALYAEMKKNGQLPNKEAMLAFAAQQNQPEYAPQRDSGISMNEPRLVSAKSAANLHQPRDSLHVPNNPELSATKGSFFRSRSWSNLKKARSEANLPSVDERRSVSPEKFSLQEVATTPGSSLLRRAQSKKDLYRQQKLSKRVSDLESKLDQARRELYQTLGESYLSYAQTPPVPELPKDVARLRGDSASSAATATAAAPRPSFERRERRLAAERQMQKQSQPQQHHQTYQQQRKTAWIPTNLPTVPSERLLFPENGDTRVDNEDFEVEDENEQDVQHHHRPKGPRKERHEERKAERERVVAEWKPPPPTPSTADLWTAEFSSAKAPRRHRQRSRGDSGVADVPDVEAEVPADDEDSGNEKDVHEDDEDELARPVSRHGHPLRTSSRADTEPKAHSIDKVVETKSVPNRHHALEEESEDELQSPHPTQQPEPPKRKRGRPPKNRTASAPNPPSSAPASSPPGPVPPPKNTPPTARPRAPRARTTSGRRSVGVKSTTTTKPSSIPTKKQENHRPSRNATVKVVIPPSSSTPKPKTTSVGVDQATSSSRIAVATASSAKTSKVALNEAPSRPTAFATPSVPARRLVGLEAKADAAGALGEVDEDEEWQDDYGDEDDGLEGEGEGGDGAGDWSRSKLFSDEVDAESTPVSRRWVVGKGDGDEVAGEDDVVVLRPGGRVPPMPVLGTGKGKGKGKGKRGKGGEASGGEYEWPDDVF
ncbi:hypothetical protein K490DRAFT_68470 [Saccharata proteae CBS 121410]|uniref:Uncharacterized protein n=1 Tax=Saccharata proteae CBS 121410 TaxID=1314787 RepID=A0A9P4HRQ0_9PEZI|nr:hypothetical protein K490DRAFT_68470 [Saccharata proteae CBS 121410]